MAIILAVVLVNAVIGVVQEGRAKKALAALKEMTSPHARIREGRHSKEILAADLLPGDVVLLEAGAQVPADLRLTEAIRLKNRGVGAHRRVGARYEKYKKGQKYRLHVNERHLRQGGGDRHCHWYGYGNRQNCANAKGDKNRTYSSAKAAGRLGKILGTVSVFLCILLFVLAVLQKRDLAKC